MTTRTASAAASFRDPAGRLFEHEGRLLRAVAPDAAADLQSFLQSRTAARFLASGSLIESRLLPVRETAALRRELGLAEHFVLAEHPRVEFPSYPHEWPAEMLHAAGELTLELAAALPEEGLGLKDATPSNVLFRGPQPVFVDALSVERRDPLDPTWLPYAQFSRTFLLPLLADKSFGLAPSHVFATRRDGLEPEEVSRLGGLLQRLRPPMLTLATIPAWLNSRHNPDDTALYRPRRESDAEKARYILDSVFRRLRRQLAAVAPADRRASHWAGYVGSDSYDREGFGEKETFVRAALAEFAPGRVLDVGCNTGHFSALAAAGGAEVVAIDSDGVAAGAAWRRAQREKLNVLALEINVARPSPGLGWRNQECRPFLERARGRFDCVLMLAVLHHLVVSERVPLEDILALAGELTRNLVLIEYVDPDDRMFQRIVRGREELHRDLTRESFEAACRRRFEIVRSQPLGNTQRRLYLLRKPAGDAAA